MRNSILSRSICNLQFLLLETNGSIENWPVGENRMERKVVCAVMSYISIIELNACEMYSYYHSSSLLFMVDLRGNACFQCSLI